MRFTKSTLVVLSLALSTTAFSALAFGKKAATTTDKSAVAAITEMENARARTQLRCVAGHHNVAGKPQ